MMWMILMIDDPATKAMRRQEDDIDIINTLALLVM